MRMPEKDENLIGKVCVCSIGRPFVVTGRKEMPWGLAWVGLSLDGRGHGIACSTNPCIIAESIQEHYDKLYFITSQPAKY